MKKLKKVDIYQYQNKSGIFVVVVKDKKISELPEKVEKLLGKLKIFKKDIELMENTIGCDPNIAFKNIKKDGYHIQGVEINFNEKLGNPFLK